MANQQHALASSLWEPTMPPAWKANPLGPSKEPPSPWAFAFRHLGRFRGAIVSALFWSILFVIVPMQVPLLSGMLVNGLLHQPASFYGLVSLTEPMQIFWFATLGFLAVAAGYALTAYMSAYSVQGLGRIFTREQRKDLIRKLDRSPMALHQQFGSGELMSRVVTDTEWTRSFVTQVFFNTVQNVVRVVYPVAVLALLDPPVALAALVVLPAQWLVSTRLQAGLRRANRTARTTKGRLMGTVKENLDGIETIQSSSAEPMAIAKVAQEADQLATDQIAAQKYMGLINGTTWGITSLGLALAWTVGGLQVMQGSLSIGVLVAATGYVALLYRPMQRFTSMSNVYQKGMVAFERIQEILEAPSELQDDPRAPPLQVTAGQIEFRDVTFRYGPSPSLAHMTGVIQGGRLTAVVGSNGSGKSTLLRLIARLYDPTQGSVLIDGQDARGVRLSSLRSQIAVVPQTPVIFTGTIEENIRLGHPSATRREIAQAALASGAGSFILRLPNGFATRVGTGGVRLSGGEAQRIAIARALVGHPRILLLDEPNSALSPEGEAQLISVLSRLKGDVTIVVVAHHLDAILAAADEVLVVDAGRIADRRVLPAAGDRETARIASPAALAVAR